MLKPITCLAAIFLFGGIASAQTGGAPPAAAPGATITPAQAQQALEVLQDPAKRAQLVETLQTIAKAAPQPSAQPATATPAAAASLTPNGLGAVFLKKILTKLATASSEVAATAAALLRMRALSHSLMQLAADPASRAMVLDAAWRLAVVLGCALIGEFLTQLLLRRPLHVLGAPRPHEVDEAQPIAPAPAQPLRRTAGRAARLFGRLPLALLRLVLELIPVAVFGAIGIALLGTNFGGSDTVRLVIFTVVNAYLVFRALLCVTRMLVSPTARRLRMLRLNDRSAVYIEAWIGRIAAVVIFGTALAEVGQILGLSVTAHDALERLFSLVADLMLVIVVLQSRRVVAARFRAPPEGHGGFAALRNRLAEIWHYIAVFLVVALWVVWAIEIPHGVTQLLRFCAITAGVLIAARFAGIVVLASLDRIFHIEAESGGALAKLEARANRYVPLLRGTVSAVISVITAVALLEAWGIDAAAWFSGNEIGRRLLSALLTIAVAAAVSVIVWEAVNATMDRHLTRLVSEAQVVREARLRTLLPVLRTTLLLVILVVVGLTALSEIGLNIAPLLAGAGIVGIAVGFGSQKLVQDVITGLFLLLENAMQVGDQVTVAGLSGAVENLSIRALWLRAGDGSVHVVPFSAVTTVTNANRGVGNAAVNVKVGVAEDTDRVSQVLRDIATEMLGEPDFKAMMLSDLQLWGVDKVDASQVTILGQIVCTASGRWGVQREFNRRMKNRFQSLGIEIANPTQTIVIKDSPRMGAEAEREAESPAAAPPSAVARRTSAS
jgi:moderate conductance mechanosensitive channel